MKHKAIILTCAACIITLMSSGAFAQLERSPLRDSLFEWPFDKRAMEDLLPGMTFTQSQLDSAIMSYMTTYHIPGVVALAISDGQIVWTGEYGWADIDRAIPASDTTVFLLASISKTFVANAIMQLWENGSIDLDADINNYLPFSVVNPNWPDDAITTRMLLTHTSSIDRNDGPWLTAITFGSDSPIPNCDFLADYLDPSGPLYSPSNYMTEAPGTTFQYCNWAFGLAACILEKITGIDFEQYCQDSLFQPLGMDETSWFQSELDTNNIATPYNYTSGAYVPYRHYGFPIYPCGQLRTSAVHLARHLIAFMRYGEIDGTRILDSVTVEYMRIPEVWDYGAIQGLAWGRNYDGFWGHGGNLYGCNTGMYFDEEENIGFIFLTNRGYTDGHAGLEYALQSFCRDYDHDGIIAGLDNCPEIYNPLQEDADMNGVGDTCDCSDANFVFEGEVPGDMLGWRVSGAGDINGDGFDDIVVGARHNSGTGTAYVFSGLNGDTLMVITGEFSGDQLGVSVGGGKDLNDDGYDDIVVGAHHHSSAGADAGRAYAFYGGTGPYPAHVSASSADLKLDGENSGDLFGWSVAEVGDIDGDNCAEIVVGAYFGTGLNGLAYVYSGSTGDELYTFIGEAPEDFFAYDLADAGDVNNDGIGDIIVGAFGNDENGDLAGRAYVFYGSSTGPYPIDRNAADADLIFTGEGLDNGFGGSVSGIGDINNDGYDDLAVGAFKAHYAAYQAGKVYVFSGMNGDQFWAKDGGSAYGLLGWAVSGVGDIDGDGYGDVAAAAPYAYSDQPWAGRAYVFSGLNGSTLRSYNGNQVYGWFGRDLIGGFDFNGDAISDLLIGAFAENSEGGAAYVHFLGYDADGDGVMAGCDNCATVPNPDQIDLDGNGVGDLCEFICGDADGSGAPDIDDVVYIIAYIFSGGPPPVPVEAGDADCAGGVDIDDVVYLITYIFSGGPAPCDPNGDEVPDC